MVRNKLFQSIIVVTLFWWAVLALLYNFVTSGNKIDHILHFRENLNFAVFYIAGFFFLVGAALANTLLKIFYDMTRKSAYSEHRVRGLIISPGAVPVRAEFGKEPTASWKLFFEGDFPRKWPNLYKWRKNVAGRNPALARLFDAIARVLRYDLDHPSDYGEVRKHGGIPLWEHSFNAAEIAVLHVSDFKVDESQNRRLKGIPLPQELYDFAVVAALAHDLGKLVCFVKQGEEVKVVRKEHDREGGRILATLDEYWALNLEDRKKILVALTYEHHPKEVPVSAGDELLILIYFVSLIDVAAAFAERNALSPVEVVEKMRTENLLNIESIASAQTQIEKNATSTSTQKNQPVQEESDDQQNVSVRDGHLGDIILEELLKPGVLNHKDGKVRLAYADKSKYRIFMQESRIREWVAKHVYNDPDAIKKADEDSRIYKLTREILCALADRGVLVQEDDNVRIDEPKYALWRIKLYDETAKHYAASSAEWVVLDVIANSKFVEAINRAPRLIKQPIIDIPVFPDKSKPKGGLARASLPVMQTSSAASDSPSVVPNTHPASLDELASPSIDQEAEETTEVRGEHKPSFIPDEIAAQPQSQEQPGSPPVRQSPQENIEAQKIDEQEMAQNTVPNDDESHKESVQQKDETTSNIADEALKSAHAYIERRRESRNIILEDLDQELTQVLDDYRINGLLIKNKIIRMVLAILIRDFEQIQNKIKNNEKFIIISMRNIEQLLEKQLGKDIVYDENGERVIAWVIEDMIKNDENRDVVSIQKNKESKEVVVYNIENLKLK